jgi:hypothetical protein
MWRDYTGGTAASVRLLVSAALISYLQRDIARHEATVRYVSDQPAIARADCNHKVTARNDRRKSSLTEQPRR